jgi:phosphoglycolate phosphatase
VSLYAGAKALLRELRGRDLKLALVSNCGPVYFGACLEALALREAFEFCACLGDGPSKQANVAAALAALGCEGGVMVGDRAGDVEAGKANGLRTIGLLHGYGGRDELREADALAVGFAGLAGLVDTVLESARASVPI